MGVTPLFSILKTALVKERHTKVVLIYSNSSIPQTVFYDALQQWQQAYPDRLEIVWIFFQYKEFIESPLKSGFSD